jgi:hypothetical protein
MRLHSWSEDKPPKLDDLVHEEPWELHRGFRVRGVEETSKPDVFRVTLERMDWEDWIVHACTRGARTWSFVRDRR